MQSQAPEINRLLKPNYSESSTGRPMSRPGIPLCWLSRRIAGTVSGASPSDATALVRRITEQLAIAPVELRS